MCSGTHCAPARVVRQHRPPKDIAPVHDAVCAEYAPQFIAQVTTVCGLPHGGANVSQNAEGATPQCQHMAMSVDSLSYSISTEIERIPDLTARPAARLCP